MTFPNNGALSARFEENTRHFNGSKVRSTTPLSPVTQARLQAQSAIAANAARQGVSLDQVVTQILYNNLSGLQMYVQSKGETPLTDPTALCIQAVFLRGQEIAMVARTLDISDEDALQAIEGAESEFIATNTPDASMVLSPMVAAAIIDALTYASQKHAGDGSLQSILSDLFSASSLIRAKLRASNFDLSDFSDSGNVSDPTAFNTADATWDEWLNDTDPSLISGMNDPSDTSPASTSISSTLATIPVGGVTAPSGGQSVAALFPTISTSGSNLPQAGGNTSGGVLNGIGSLLGSITTLFGGVTTAANSAAAAGGAINNAISNVGANSIATYISQNKNTILFVFFLIIALILVIAYARKK